MADVVGKHTKDLAVMLQQLRLHRCQKRKDWTLHNRSGQSRKVLQQFKFRTEKIRLRSVFASAPGLPICNIASMASTDGTHRLPNISFRHRSFTRPRRRMFEQVRLPGDHTTLVSRPPKGAEKQVNEIAASYCFAISPRGLPNSWYQKAFFYRSPSSGVTGVFSYSTS